ncbi:MAG TPA: hypothetical protein VKU01_35735 [Bryobacteraceae bacterium]|nr:hypothetical protein [Bryobacteraceae bacterium]
MGAVRQGITLVALASGLAYAGAWDGLFLEATRLDVEGHFAEAYVRAIRALEETGVLHPAVSVLP